jgi:5'-3' exonuclease
VSCDWLFVDGSSMIFRAFFAMPDTVRSPDGRSVNAVRGFIDTLARLVTNRRPRHIAVASDADWRPAWRVELLPTYKAHRVAEPIPPGLIPQMPVIDEILAAIGVDAAGVTDYEAEDVIATWTAQVTGTVEIASGDRDLFALVEDSRIVVLYPEKAGQTVIDEAEVARRYGVPGRRYSDFAVLRGDPSDGLPGLKRVGPVAAAALVHKYGSLEGVLENGALADTDRDYLERAMRVVPPVRDLPIQLPDGRRALYPSDAARLADLTQRYGVQASSERLVAALNANDEISVA